MPVDRAARTAGWGVVMRTSGTAEEHEPTTAREIEGSGGLREQQWANLVRVNDGMQYKPIIGADASFPAIPLADKLLKAWSVALHVTS